MYKQVRVKADLKARLEAGKKRMGLRSLSDYIAFCDKKITGDYKPVVPVNKGKGGKSVSFYLTETEEDILLQLASNEPISPSQYVASLIRQQADLPPLGQNELEESINRMAQQLRAVGININQQTRAIKKKLQNEEDYKNDDYFKTLELLNRKLEETIVVVSSVQQSLKRY